MYQHRIASESGMGESGRTVPENAAEAVDHKASHPSPDSPIRVLKMEFIHEQVRRLNVYLEREGLADTVVVDAYVSPTLEGYTVARVMTVWVKCNACGEMAHVFGEDVEEDPATWVTRHGIDCSVAPWEPLGHRRTR